MPPLRVAQHRAAMDGSRHRSEPMALTWHRSRSSIGPRRDSLLSDLDEPASSSFEEQRPMVPTRRRDRLQLPAPSPARPTSVLAPERAASLGSPPAVDSEVGRGGRGLPPRGLELAAPGPGRSRRHRPGAARRAASDRPVVKPSEPAARRPWRRPAIPPRFCVASIKLPDAGEGRDRRHRARRSTVGSGVMIEHGQPAIARSGLACAPASSRASGRVSQLLEVRLVDVRRRGPQHGRRPACAARVELVRARVVRDGS